MGGRCGAVSGYPRAQAIIDPNPMHKRAVAKLNKTEAWKMLYARRTGVERVNGRLKAHRKLDFVRVRSRFKVRVHALLAVIVLQAQALATGTRA